MPKEDLFSMAMETLLTGHGDQICQFNCSYLDVMQLDKCDFTINPAWFGFRFSH